MANPPGIECADWKLDPRDSKGKRCVHYQGSGTCDLAERFVCEEWAKANAGRSCSVVGTSGPSAAPPAAPAQATDRPTGYPSSSPPGGGRPEASQVAANGKSEDVATDFLDPGRDEVAFRLAILPPTEPKQKNSKVIPFRRYTPDSPPSAADQAMTDNLTTLADVDEALIRSDQLGDIVLVHSLTGQDRKELTFQAASIIKAIVDVIPSAKLLSVTMKRGGT